MINLPENCYRVSVKALIYNEEWKFLLSKESNGRWDIPGGWLDHGENPLDWLKREIKEEMWLEIITIKREARYIFSAYRATSKTHDWVINICYEVKLKNLEFMSSDECVEIWFFTPEEAFKLDLFENVEVLCQEMLRETSL